MRVRFGLSASYLKPHSKLMKFEPLNSKEKLGVVARLRRP